MIWLGFIQYLTMGARTGLHPSLSISQSHNYTFGISTESADCRMFHSVSPLHKKSEKNMKFMIFLVKYLSAISGVRYKDIDDCHIY